MIKKFKNKIKQFEDRFRKIDAVNKLSTSNQERIKSNQQILFDYNQLSTLFSKNEFIPFTEWSLSPSTILHILNDILLNDKKNIVEFGCGSSSLYIAKFLEKLGSRSNYYCIESNEEWLNKMRFLAERYEISKFINFVHAPMAEIEEQYGYKNQKLWYDIATVRKVINNVKEIDLVLIDGPVGIDSPYARYSAIPLLKKKFAKNISIFLDDTFRKEEMEILEEWKRILTLQSYSFAKYSMIADNISFSSEPLKLRKWE